MELTLMARELVDRFLYLCADLGKLEIHDRINAINLIKMGLRRVSPLNAEPVDCVLWVKNETVEANDYNPNVVAPPEMLLLESSILQDGYTQPVVTFQDGSRREVVDGFHRHQVGQTSKDIKERTHGYLPVTTIN